MLAIPAKQVSPSITVEEAGQLSGHNLQTARQRYIVNSNISRASFSSFLSPYYPCYQLQYFIATTNMRYTTYGVNRYSPRSRLQKMGGARIKPARALRLHWQYDHRSPWQVIQFPATSHWWRVNKITTITLCRLLLAYSYTRCGTKYRYAHSTVSLTSPTHLREHIKRCIAHSITQICPLQGLIDQPHPPTGTHQTAHSITQWQR